jgi:hypothetical protein
MVIEAVSRSYRYRVSSRDIVYDRPYGGVDLVELTSLVGVSYDPIGAGTVTRKSQSGTIAA